MPGPGQLWPGAAGLAGDGQPPVAEAKLDYKP